MRAIVFEQPGGEDVLRLGEVPTPEVGDEELLIRVVASAVNRADLLQRQGFYPPPPGASPILGLECAGEVAAVGGKVRGWKVGDRAMALLPGGGYAEMATVHAGSAMPIPVGMSDEEAGAFPEVFLTAFLNVFLLGAPPDGATVLVHGGGSGVGTATLALCKEAGLAVIATAGSDAKCDRCVELGARAAINYNSADFAAEVKKLTDGRGVAVVLDCIGAKYLARNLDCLGMDGRLVLIGMMGGTRAEIDLAALLLKRIHVIGSTLRSRRAADKADIVDRFRQRFFAAVEAGRVRPIIDRVMPLAQAGEAHRLMKASEHFGKIVLRVAES
jgi:putative PIG3 family NAD(P)H quinone oxidoreductase